MGRPIIKTDLLTIAAANYEKLNILISRLIEKELSTSFDFSSDEKRKRLVENEIKNFEIYSSISINDISFLKWVYYNQNGNSKPFLPEPYN